MTIGELAERWLASYNTSREVTDESFDFEMGNSIFNLSGADKLKLIEALSESDLKPQAEGMLGAGLFEDLMSEYPELIAEIENW